MELKNRIQSLIANNKIEQAIRELLAWAKNNHNRELEDDLLLIMSRYTQVKRQENLGIIQFSDALQQQAVISNSVLNFLNKLETEVIIGSPPEVEKPEEKQKVILFLASNPSHTAKLQLEKEYVQIARKLQDQTDKFRLVAEWAVTPGLLQEAILKHRPHLIHFSGHGLGDSEAGQRGTRPASSTPKTDEEDIGGIVLQNANGRPQFVNGKALTGLFRIITHKIPVKIVILNACHSKEQARAINEYVPFVIGMDRTIDDNAAIGFSTGFYNSIASDESVEYAYELAKNRIELEGLPDGEVPLLYKKEDAGA